MARQLMLVVGVVFLSMATMVRCIGDTIEDQQRACIRDLESVWLIENAGHRWIDGRYYGLGDLTEDELHDLMREVCR